MDGAGNCPSGFTKCDGNGKLSKENKVCISDSDFSNSGCPITAIHFMSKNTND